MIPASVSVLFLLAVVFLATFLTVHVPLFLLVRSLPRSTLFLRLSFFMPVASRLPPPPVRTPPLRRAPSRTQCKE